MEIPIEPKAKISAWSLILPAFSAVFLPVLYYLTCFRTFTWWDSCEYSISALTHGVPHPPGSLITVLIGWFVTMIPWGIDKFFTLNLTTSLMAILAAFFTGYIALRLVWQTEDGSYTSPGQNIGLVSGIALAALLYGVSETSWFYAIRFTPYTLTALFTAVIVISMLAWQRHSRDANAHLWLALTAFLFGLDFSVHRTNFLMLPALFVWVLIFNPRAFSSLKSWLYGIVSLIAGLSVHLIIIPIARTNPLMNANDPSNLARFWDYISLKQYGADWLINLYPRKADFFSGQMGDYIKVFSDNFANSHLAPLGYLPLAIGLFGLFMLFKRNRRLGLGFVALFLCSSMGAIIYFNRPEGFFRSIDRHYMPSFVIFGIFIAYGAGHLLQASFRIGTKLKVVAIGVCLVFLALMPLQAILRNYRAVDGSKSFFAYNAARNFLANLPEDAVFFTQADIDTYTLWALQYAEGFRTDVTICNMSLMNTSWFIKQIMQRDSKFPFRLDEKELSALAPIPWKDSVMVLPIQPAGDNVASSETEVILTVPPSPQGGILLVQDQMVMNTIEANNWKRPICFSSMLPQSTIGWLMPNLRLEGLHWRLIPARDEIVDRELLRKNLFERYDYSGYTDSTIMKDDPTKWVGWNLWSAFITLAYMDQAAGDSLACRNTYNQLLAVLPPQFLMPPKPMQDAMANACQ